jgi:hypothetical protein
VSNFQISASLDDQGELTISGSGFPPNATITIRATYGGTIYNTWAQSTSDSGGSFTYQQPQFTSTCVPGLWKIDATDGSPDPAAPFNYNWSNEADVTCPARATSPPPSSTPPSGPASTPPASSGTPSPSSSSW